MLSPGEGVATPVWSAARRTVGRLVIAGLLAGAAGCSLTPDDTSHTVTDASVLSNEASSSPPTLVAAPAPFDTKKHSTTDPDSIWVVVNKRHPITPADHRPGLTLVRGYQVARPAAAPLARMLDDSDRVGLGLKIASAFRSYGYQQGVHAATVAAQGQAAADEVSARPGHSEHQTGFAVDVITPDAPGCNFEECFASTPAGQWLAENAWRHGFLVRYAEGDESVTGYRAEPWHLRFVGRPLTRAMRESGVSTLEEFLDVSGGDYPER